MTVHVDIYLRNGFVFRGGRVFTKSMAPGRAVQRTYEHARREMGEAKVKGRSAVRTVKVSIHYEGSEG